MLAYLSYPVYKKALGVIKNKVIASGIVAFLLVIILTVPFIIVLGLVSKEAYATYNTLNQQKLGTNFINVVCSDQDSWSCQNIKTVVGFLPQNDLDYYIQSSIRKITVFILDNFSHFISSIPLIMLNIFVMMFIVYYLLKDGEAISKRIKSILPLKGRHKEHVFERFHNITYAVFYVNIFVAIIQGILGGIGFFLLGVGSPILWGFVMIIFALIPYFGTAVVWLPAALNLIFMGYLQNDNTPIIKGVILLAYGIVVVSSIDNIIKPKLIGTKANVHPILVLIGVLGGLNLFGFIGFLLGPVILALLMTFVEIYEEEKTELKEYF